VSDLRKVILKILLGSLAVAAVAGILGVFVARDVIWRVVGTGFLTAVAALLMLPLSHMIDRHTMRAAGLLGMSAVVVEFTLILMLIWELAGVFGSSWRVEQALWSTAGIVAGSTVAAMGCLLALHRSDIRIAGMVGLAMTAVFVVVSMIATGTWLAAAAVDHEWWATAATVPVVGLLSMAALVGVGGGDRRHWRWAGVAAAVATGIIMLVDFWANKSDEKILSLFLAAGIYVAWANLIVRVPLKPGQRWLLYGTLGSGAVSILLTELIVFDVHHEIVLRGAGATGIVAACGTMALALLARLNRRVDFRSTSDEWASVVLSCPRCRRKQTIGLGGATCKACGLRIDVRVEEPSCANCGYLLYKLTSDVCPECGTSIPGDAAATAE